MILPLFMLLAAQDAPLNCDKQETQSDMNRCADRGYEEADREMNAQWKITLAAMRESDRGTGEDGFGPPSAQLLLESQRAWLAYRDAQCVVQGQYARGGSMQPMLESNCKEMLTAERTETLRRLLEE